MKMQITQTPETKEPFNVLTLEKVFRRLLTDHAIRGLKESPVSRLERLLEHFDICMEGHQGVWFQSGKYGYFRTQAEAIDSAINCLMNQRDPQEVLAVLFSEDL